MTHPLGANGPVKENMAERICKQEPEAFEVVTLRMVVPKGWGDHYVGRIKQRYELAHTGLQINGYVEDVEPFEWERIKWDAEFNASMFDIGEWVEIKTNEYGDEINNMIPDFVPGTIGQIVGIRWGWTTPYLVAVETPVTEVDGTEWCRDDNRPTINFYYNWHQLRRLELAEIPEKYRKTARQRVEAKESELTPEQLADRERITEEIIAKIKAEEAECPGESYPRRLARLRKEQQAKG
jgi:hypothetical protein